MEDLKKIIANISKEVNEDSIMVEYTIDIDTPPFMCSPYDENWIWSKNTIDLNRFIYDVLIPEYLINMTSVFNGDIVEDKYYPYLEALELFKKSDKYSSNIDKHLDELSEMYDTYNDKEISYLEFIKMLIRLEKVLNHTGICFKPISYVNPYEARFSKMLKTNYFDYKNLEKNF